jgi:hypothetical protein
MKRLFTAILVLSAAAALCFGLHQSAAASRRDIATRTAAWENQKQQLELLRLRQQQLTRHMAETRQSIASQPAIPPADQLKMKVLSGASWRSYSPAECEQLLAELGFNWNTTGDYLIISKQSLDKIEFGVLSRGKLTSAATAMFALSPEEQSSLNDLAKQLNDAHIAWAQQHLQRTEPSGNIVAQYSLPVDTDFAQNQLATFTNGIYNILGTQRADWFRADSYQWQMANGMNTGPDLSKIPADMMPQIPASALAPQPTTMTLERSQSGDDTYINLTVHEGGGTMSSSIYPNQPVPDAFKPLFPGGWPEIAQREGFQLPKSFDKP